MRNLLALIGLLLVVTVGVGIYRDWFKFSVDSDKNVNISVNSEKALRETKEGLAVGADKLKDIADNLKKDKDGNTISTPTPASTSGPALK